PGDKLDQAIAAAHQDGPPELKLARLEAAVCEPGVRDVLKHDPRRLAAYQSAYSSCADALANELSVLNRHIYAQIDNLDNVEVKKQKYGYRIPLSHRMVTTSFNMLAQHVSRSIVSE